MLLGSRGATIGEVRDLLRLDPKASLVGICGCSRHYKAVREGAFVPSILQSNMHPSRKEAQIFPSSGRTVVYRQHVYVRSV